MDDRRKFERVRIPASAGVYVKDSSGQRMGTIQMLGRGGMLVSGVPEREIPATLHIVDDSEGIDRPVQTVLRYRNEEGAGLQFQELDSDTAVEIGVIIGKYYAAAAGN